MEWLEHIEKSIMTSYDNNDILSSRSGIKIEHMLIIFTYIQYMYIILILHNQILYIIRYNNFNIKI